MKAKEVVLFVYDENEHFNNYLEFLGDSTFKKIIRIDSLDSLTRELSFINDDEFVFLIVHVFYTEKIKGLKKYVASGIKERYPLLGGIYVSDGSEKTIQKEMVDEFDTAYIQEIKKYHQVRSSIENETVNVFTKKEVVSNVRNLDLTNISNTSMNFDYVIITALEIDEMEKVLSFIKKDGKLQNDKHLIEFGHFINKPEKKVVYASQLATGMIDASILATELLVRFKPKFLIMPGVMGGKPKDTKIGDVIVSTKVFTVDKGKLSATEFNQELEVTNVDSAYITEFKRAKTKIKRFIEDANSTRNDDISIHFEPIACVRSVIDKENYFVENISTVDRKTIGLEMESYGIARACELVNNGTTIPLIIKSVMDNTTGKTDDAKTYAAWTSAMFIKYIIENDLI